MVGVFFISSQTIMALMVNDIDIHSGMLPMQITVMMPHMEQVAIWINKITKILRLVHALCDIN